MTVARLGPQMPEAGNYFDNLQGLPSSGHKTLCIEPALGLCSSAVNVRHLGHHHIGTHKNCRCLWLVQVYFLLPSSGRSAHPDPGAGRLGTPPRHGFSQASGPRASIQAGVGGLGGQKTRTVAPSLSLGSGSCTSRACHAMESRLGAACCTVSVAKKNLQAVFCLWLCSPSCETLALDKTLSTVLQVAPQAALLVALEMSSSSTEK